MKPEEMLDVGPSSALDVNDTHWKMIDLSEHDISSASLSNIPPYLCLPTLRSLLSTSVLTESTLQHLSFNVDKPEGCEPPKSHVITCIIKLILSFGLIISLVVGYVLSFHVVTLGPWSPRMYGIILLADFLVQFMCSLFNQYSVNWIATQAFTTATDMAYEKVMSQSDQPCADISMTIGQQ
jgi:hypothetical protein